MSTFSRNLSMVLGSTLVFGGSLTYAYDWQYVSSFQGKSHVLHILGQHKSNRPAAEEFTAPPWPPYYQLGFERIDFDVYLKTLDKGGLSVWFGATNGDRFSTGVPLDGLSMRVWHHVSLGKKDFRVWKYMGDGNPGWELISGPVVFTLNLGEKGAADLYVANLQVISHEGREHFNTMTSEPEAGKRTYVGGKSLWAGPLPLLPDYDKDRDVICIGAGAGYLLGENGIQIGKDLRLRFPDANIILSGAYFPSMEAPCSLRKLRSMGIFYQFQKAGGSLALLRANDVLFQDWRGKTFQGDWHTLYIATSLIAQQDLKAEIDNAALLGVNNFKQIDYVWPWIGGRWGYDVPTVAAFRTDLLQKDDGLDVLIAAGQRRTIHFWDYFEDYSGIRFQPSDLGFSSWQEYVPTTEQAASTGTIKTKRNLRVFITLYHYEYLRLAQRLGRWAKAHHGSHDATLNPEDLGNGGDYIYLLRLADFGIPYFEYFGSPVNTEGAYFHMPMYRRQADKLGKRIGAITELGPGGHGRPYCDPRTGYCQVYDLTASGHDAYHNEWMDECSYEEMTNPSSAYHYDRWMNYLAEAYGYTQARHDKAARSQASVVSVSLRSVVHYMAGWTWGLDCSDSFMRSLANEHIDAEECDIQNLSDVLDSADVLFYTPPFTPANRVELIDKWLNDPRHVMVTHSYIPMAIDPGATVQLRSGIKAVVYKGEKPEDSYANLYLQKDGQPTTNSIHPIFSDITIDGTTRPMPATSDIPAVAKALGEVTIPAGLKYYRWVVNGDQVLIRAGTQPILTEVTRTSGARVIYLHLRLMSLPESIRTRLTAAIAAYLMLPRIALPDGQFPVLVHSYKFDLGHVAVLYDRGLLEKWGFAAGYTDNLSQRPYVYQQSGARGCCRFVVDTPGTYRVFYFLEDRQEIVQVSDQELLVPLHLKDCLTDVIYIAPDSDTWQARISSLQRFRRERVNEWDAKCRLDSQARILDGQDEATGAVWRWEGPADNIVAHEPWKGESGVVFFRFDAVVPDAAILQGTAKVLYEGGDGVALTTLKLGPNGKLTVLNRQNVPADKSDHAFKINLGKSSDPGMFYLLLDGQGSTLNDTTVLKGLMITDRTSKVLLDTSELRDRGQSRYFVGNWRMYVEGKL